MAKENEFLLTLIATERVCVPIKAKTLSEAKAKLIEGYKAGNIDGIETVEVYEGNLYQFAEPLDAEEWLSFVKSYGYLIGRYAKSRKVK